MGINVNEKKLNLLVEVPNTDRAGELGLLAYGPGNSSRRSSITARLSVKALRGESGAAELQQGVLFGTSIEDS
jgi:hypothetical protein